MKKQLISIILLLLVMVFAVFFQEFADSERYIIYGLLIIVSYLAISEVVDDNKKK